jgi:hypothetical protein
VQCVPSGLLTYIIHPCSPSLLTSRCQLAPPSPSPLAIELLHAADVLPPPAAYAIAAARSHCPGYPTPSASYVTAALLPLSPAAHVSAAATPRSCLNPTAEQTPAAYQVRPPLTKTISRVLPPPRERFRAFFFIRPHPRWELRLIKYIEL